MVRRPERVAQPERSLVEKALLAAASTLTSTLTGTVIKRAGAHALESPERAGRRERP